MDVGNISRLRVPYEYVLPLLKRVLSIAPRILISFRTTVRNFSNMALIRPSYNPESDTITITAPAPDSIDEKYQFTILAHPSPAWLNEHTQEADVKIWGKPTSAHAYPASLTAPFDTFFGKEVRLVYKSPFSDSPRPLASNGSKNILGREASTCFPDLMPILVGCESSIDELNTRLKATDDDMTVDIRRFRPNIVVRGDMPWDEDRWKTLRIVPARSGSEGKALVLDVTQRCARCQVPNVDPDTAEKHQRQPWNTLMGYRRIDEGITYKPCFGMLSAPRNEGAIEVGMKFEVLEETRNHRYVKGF